MSQEKWQILLQEFSQHIELDGLTPDEQGNYLLVFDDTISLNLHYNEDNGMLTLYAPLLEIPEDRIAELCPRLLQANLFWQGTAGATLGMDSENRLVILALQRPLETLDMARLETLLQSLVSSAEYWLDELGKTPNLSKKDTPAALPNQPILRG